MKCYAGEIDTWRGLFLRLIILFPIALAGACGGGGDEGPDGDFGDEPPIIPTTLRLLLAEANGAPLVISSRNGLTVTTDFTDIVFGSVNLTVNDDNTVIFDSYTTFDTEGLAINVNTTDGSPLDGKFAFTVVDGRPIETNVGAAPSSGQFTIETLTELVTVKILNEAEVEVIFNNQGDPIKVTYTWDELTGLFSNDTLETWQRRASIAAATYELIYDLALSAADTLDELETNPVTESCDMFSGSPPDGVLAEGENTITWLGSGEVKSGDDFAWRFTDCWRNEALDDTDDLINGAVSLENYTEVVSVVNILIEIGFGSLSDGLGGVIFDDLKVSATKENAGVFTIDPDDEITVNGGFAVVLQSL